jgi:hypothetical protein
MTEEENASFQVMKASVERLEQNISVSVAKFERTVQTLIQSCNEDRLALMLLVSALAGQPGIDRARLLKDFDALVEANCAADADVPVRGLIVSVRAAIIRKNG